MKKLILVTITILTGAGFAQSIDETLQQIAALKKEIAQNEKLVEEKIADLKRTNPLFAEQDMFESDAEYLGRMSRAMPQLDRLRKQYLDDLWQKMSILRGRMFETSDVTVTLDKNLYDANNEIWPIVIQHNAHQQERFERTINITKKNAATLFKNWVKVQKTGVLTVDVGDKIGLAKFRLNDPISGFEFKHEFRPMKTLRGSYGIFNPDGKHFYYKTEKNDAVIYDLENDGVVKEIDCYGFGNHIVSPDGKLYAVWEYSDRTNKDNVKIYNELGNYIRRFKVDVYNNSTHYDLAFSPDGKFLAFASWGWIKIYNIITKTEVMKFDPVRHNYDLAFSPDGKLLAANSGNVYNLETGATAHKFTGGRSVAFSPDGEYLAIGGERKQESYNRSTGTYAYTDPINIYSLKTGQKVRSMGGSHTVNDIAYSPDGKYLAASWGAINIYELSTGNVVRSYDKGDNVTFSPDGKYVVSEGTIYRTLFQVEEEVLAQKAISRPPALSASVSFSEPSGNQFLDAMESGAITLTMTNTGAGPGKGVLAKVTPERTGNLNYNNTYIEEVPPGKSVSAEIPLEAYIGIADGEHTFRFDFEEINGFPPDPVELQFSTKAYLNPEMYIVDVGIEDDNMNGKIESGEMINVMVRIGNRGKGTARSAYAKLYAGDNVFITEKHPKTVKMGELAYNASIDIPLEFFVNDKTVDEIPLYVDLTEENSLANVSKLRLPIKKSERARQIGRTVVTGIEQDYGQLTLGADLSIDIEQDIPETGKKNKYAVAIVIGNKNYTNPDVPEVTFAHRDAAVMEQYLTKTLGYREVIVETDATQGKFFSLFGTEKKDGKLQDYVKEGESDVFIYYSGHGAPDPESKDGYFVPVDCDPAMVDVTGYSLDLFYNKINNLGAKSVTVVIDACFSGSSDQGMLLKNISPVFIEVDETGQLADEVTVFTSSSGEQVSSWYPEKKHSLYTYFFLKGLKGSADVDEDQSVTAEEMQFYVNEEVGFMARKLNSREQTPGLRTLDEKKVLIQY